jgi:hypothetical protein
MILGGIQGDEPGGFLSADLYVDLALKKGNLIVVPRANFRSIISFARGTDGDMNRKFDDVTESDPDRERVEIIKNLMAEADLFLNLHDGSGFFRTSWESDMANPNRYGQCIIADAEVYTHPNSPRVLHLGQDARTVVEIVNQDIPEERYKFHFANHDTLAADTKHADQRKSATFYALTQLGIPAFGIETSKQLPSLEMKIFQHNLAINAFLSLYGVEIEHPRIHTEQPILYFMLLSVNGGVPLALEQGQTLFISPGDKVEVTFVGANYERGLSVDILNFGTLNDIRVPIGISNPTSIIARKDNIKFGEVKIEFLPPEAELRPAIEASNNLRVSGAGAGILPVPSEVLVAANDPQAPVTDSGTPGTLGDSSPIVPLPPNAPNSGTAGSVTVPLTPAAAGETLAPGGISGFALEIDGTPVRLSPGEVYTVKSGAKIKMVDIISINPLPDNVVMNLKGFIGRAGDTTGNDKGTVCDTKTDLIARFAINKDGVTVYQLGAEDGPTILSTAFIRVLVPKLKSVTFELGGEEKVLKLQERWKLAPGTAVTLKAITLEGDLPLVSPRITLGGRPVPQGLPQVLIMPDIAVSLAVFSAEELMGKVVLYP